MFAELDVEISEEEIIMAMKMLSSGRSGGPDRLLNCLFNHGVATLPKYLKHLYCYIIFETGYFPTCWTEGHIVPIHKQVLLVL